MFANFFSDDVLDFINIGCKSNGYFYKFANRVIIIIRIDEDFVVNN